MASWLSNTMDCGESWQTVLSSTLLIQPSIFQYFGGMNLSRSGGNITTGHVDHKEALELSGVWE